MIFITSWNKSKKLLVNKGESMLSGIHVKNIALIDEVWIDFDKGLNILTGETGAGKSIIIDSINVALGKKALKEMLRKGADDALVELFFDVHDASTITMIKSMEIDIEDNTIIISRRLSNGRSTSRINGDIVSAKILKNIADRLIDIHGQHEHQSLLYKSKHLEILDRFAKEQLGSKKQQMTEAYEIFKQFNEELLKASIDEEKRLREISLMEYEINEIDEANLIAGEDVELMARYKKMTNARQIVEGINAVRGIVGYESGGLGDGISHALKFLYPIQEYDEQIADYVLQIENIDNLLNDFNRETAEYMSDLTFDEHEYIEAENRLDLLNHLKSKYGKTIEEILTYREAKLKELKKLENYEEYLNDLKQKLNNAKKELITVSEEVSKIRQEQSSQLSLSIKEALIDLNFLDVAFEMRFSKTLDYTRNGIDEAEFVISTNPGEDLKPLGMVASGGELSRIMLAIKSVLARADDLDSLIFDEIDSGISGRTAQKVAEKLAIIAAKHQVFAITHLPQIAAMADHHYLIEKLLKDNRTLTTVKPLDEALAIQEIARLLGGVEITAKTLENAIEMKSLAANSKKY